MLCRRGIYEAVENIVNSQLIEFFNVGTVFVTHLFSLKAGYTGKNFK